MALLREPLLEILEEDCGKSIDVLVEELRVEYPRIHQQVMQLFAEKYDLSSCSAQQSPLTAVNQMLQIFAGEGLAGREASEGLTLWRRIPPAV